MDDGILYLLKLELVVEVYVEMILLQKFILLLLLSSSSSMLLLLLMMMMMISPLAFNFCTEFTRNYALSLLRYFAPETKDSLLSVYSLFPGWTLDLISKTTPFNTKLCFTLLHLLLTEDLLSLTFYELYFHSEYLNFVRYFFKLHM